MTNKTLPVTAHFGESRLPMGRKGGGEMLELSLHPIEDIFSKCRLGTSDPLNLTLCRYF